MESWVFWVFIANCELSYLFLFLQSQFRSKVPSVSLFLIITTIFSLSKSVLFYSIQGDFNFIPGRHSITKFSIVFPLNYEISREIKSSQKIYPNKVYWKWDLFAKRTWIVLLNENCVKKFKCFSFISTVRWL